MASALCVLTQPEAEVEYQLDQVGNVPGLWVGGGGSRSQDELDDAQGGEFFPLEWRIFNLISFELAGESLVQADMSLGVGGFSGIR